jgi:hypothetical protein
MNINQIRIYLCMSKEEIQQLGRADWNLPLDTMKGCEEEVRAELSILLSEAKTAPDFAKSSLCDLAAALSGIADDLQDRRCQLNSELKY